MTSVGLRIGPIAVPGTRIVRSGFRWLVPDGGLCRAGEPVAFCTVGLTPERATPGVPGPFDDEQRDFQAVLAPRVGGRIRHGPQASRGGFLDQLSSFVWDGGFEIGRLEPSGACDAAGDDPGLLRLTILAGRRMTELAEVRSGLLTGWHDRSRAWSGEGTGATGTLLAIATCEQVGILRGQANSYGELFAAVSGPAQVVVIQDEPLVPCARVIVEQMTRTAAQRAAIAEDLARTFTAGPVPTPGDWLFAGALATALDRSPVTDSYPILRRDGLHRTGHAAAVLLSLNAELLDVGRHRRLGYTVAVHNWRLVQAGPAASHWLRTHFERVRRSVDDVRSDYLALIEQVRATTGARLLVLNTNTSPAHEQIHSYAGLAEPLSATLGGIRAKELALMLGDLAREHDLNVVDADALIARFGLLDHMPDGTHHSGPLQDALRDAVLDVLRERRVAGFASC